MDDRPTTRLGRISAIVDRELTAIEKDLDKPEAEPAPLGRLEMLARLIRQLDLQDTNIAADNPYEGLPPELLRQVLQHAKPKP